MFKVFSQRLYLRIWLAVVGGVAVLTLVVGWAWRVAEEYNASNNAQQTNNARELVIRDGQGQILLQGPFERIRRPGADGVVFNIEGTDGQTYHLEMAPRAQPGGGNPRDRAGGGRPPPGHGGQDWAFWLRPPFGFLWLLGLIGLVVVVGVFPIIRRLLKRLENLQRGVQRFGEGDLSVRVPTEGRDEVADLACQFNAAAGRIEALVQSHKSLLANASHELRSPLARIRMGLELMGGDSASVAAAKAEIQRNIAELDQLVDEILLASRLESPEVDVGTMEVLDLIGLAAEECARVDADLDVEATEGLEVPAIAKLVRRALRNLLENARRYSHGEVSLTLSREGAMAVIRVEDIGPGVPPAQRERIFEKFYRLPGASERSGGVGLGLSLVRSIAQRHGGSVRCEDRRDGRPGASFVLRLPLQAAG
ncbi:ATP-binding protein [Comamonas aquatica]|uniref:ATP-binding protein n=1 Tax=Comamonas aquatica TaxID=225991 RepID=UPI00244C10E2|nr:ATP-binding protein [Comamonas aquatica]MDH0381967.1 ATP-binding protein [Comamonas aquatica]MDH0430253.1 ATP-binding protein [Comamonas aquatica]MDH0941060.1 ATP-binding protein [Comamonas aquatica]